MSEQRKFQLGMRGKPSTGIFTPADNFNDTTRRQTRPLTFDISSSVMPSDIASHIGVPIDVGGAGLTSNKSIYQTSSAHLPHPLDMTSREVAATTSTLSGTSQTHRSSPVRHSISSALNKPQLPSSMHRPDSVKETSDTTNQRYGNRSETSTLSKENLKFESRSTPKILRDNRRNVTFTKASSKVDSPSVIRSIADNVTSKTVSEHDSSSDDSERELRIVEEASDIAVRSSTSKEGELSQSNRTFSDIKLEPIRNSATAISSSNTGDIKKSPEASVSNSASKFRISSTSSTSLNDSGSQGSLVSKMPLSHGLHSVQNIIGPNSAFTATGAQAVYLSGAISNSAVTNDHNDDTFVKSTPQSRSDNDNAEATGERGSDHRNIPSGSQTATALYLQGSPIPGLRYPGPNILPQAYHVSSSATYPTVQGSTSQAIQSTPHIAHAMNNVVLVDHRNIHPVMVTLPQTTAAISASPITTVSTISIQPSTNAVATCTPTGSYEAETVTTASRIESPQTIRQPNSVTSPVCPSRPSILRKRFSDGSRKTTPTKELSTVSASNQDISISHASFTSKMHVNNNQAGATVLAVNTVNTMPSTSNEKNTDSVEPEATDIQTITPRKKPRKQAVVLTEDQYASNLPTDSTDSSETEVGEEVVDINEDDLSVPVAIIEARSAPIQKNSKPHLDYEQLVLLRNRKRTSILNGAKCNNKAAHNHFQRYSDVKRRDEKQVGLSEICNQRDILQRLQGWKIFHLTAQLEDMAKVEQSIYSKIYRLQECMSTYRHGRNSKGEDFSMMYELLQGNIQRCRLVIEQVEEVKTLMHKMLEHKHLGAEILKKYMEKRQIKKKP